LEHAPEWAELTRRWLQLFDIRSAQVVTAPLRTNAKYEWYETSGLPMNLQWSFVICDGPPGMTQGGRYGLLPQLASRLAPGCIVLLDDASRPGEQQVIEKWKAEFGVQVLAEKTTERFTVLSLPPSSKSAHE
jgi:hypothetical protein